MAAWCAGALAAGAWIGLRFPDVDQRVDFLLHRSFITHGPLLPLLVRRARRLAFRIFPMFLCRGFMVHLAFDLFPRGWSGYALISIPVYGWLPSVVSVLWIASSALLCAYWAARLARGLLESVIVVVGAAGISIVAVPGENSVIGPLTVVAAFLGTGGTVSLFRWVTPPANA